MELRIKILDLGRGALAALVEIEMLEIQRLAHCSQFLFRNALCSAFGGQALDLQTDIVHIQHSLM